MTAVRLAITIHWNNDIIDSRVVDVVGPMVMGDAPGAVVSFPGVAIPVSPCPEGVAVGGRLIRAGERHELDLGDVRVELRVERAQRLRRERLVSGDPALLVLTGAMIVFGLWWDTVDRWATTNPTVVAELEALPSMWSRMRDAEPAPIVEPDPVYAPEVRYQD